MKSLNTNNKKDLIALKESFSKVVDGRIRDIEVKECYDAINNYNVGNLKALFESVSDKLFETEQGKKNIGKYAKLIKENTDLKDTYTLFNILTKPHNIANTEMFLNEAIAINKKTNSKKLNEGRNKLASLIIESLELLQLSKEEIDSLIEPSKFSLNESINYLVTTEKNNSNIADYVNNATTVINFLNENIKQENNVEINENVNAVSELNELLSEKEEWEKNVINDIVLCNISNSSKQDLFETYKKKCLNIIEESLEETDIETKSRLNNIKSQIILKEYKEDKFNSDLLNLSELIQTLS